MGAREGLPLWDLARDLHRWGFLPILRHTPAFGLLLLLHGLRDLHPAAREQKVFGDRSALGLCRNMEDLNGWLSFEVSERRQTPDAPTHTYSPHVRSSTGFGVTTHLNKDLQKNRFWCVDIIFFPY